LEQLSVLVARTRFFKGSMTSLTPWVTSPSKNHFPASSCNFESRNEILLKGGRLLSYGPRWAHYLGGYQDRLQIGPLGLPDLCRTVPDGERRKDYGGEVLGYEAIHTMYYVEDP
jgi:hypothetical protein